MAIYGLRPAVLREIRLSDTDRGAILGVLGPHLLDPDSGGAALKEIEGLASLHRADLEAGMNDPEQPRKRTLSELAELSTAAAMLRSVTDDLSPATRARVTEILGGERLGDPPESAGMASPEALNQLAVTCTFLEERVALARRAVENEPRTMGRRVKLAQRQFVHDLAGLWERYTGQRLPVGNPDRTPWGRFVQAVFRAVGADGSPLYLARVVATQRRRVTRRRGQTAKTTPNHPKI